MKSFISPLIILLFLGLLLYVVFSEQSATFQDSFRRDVLILREHKVAYTVKDSSCNAYYEFVEGVSAQMLKTSKPRCFNEVLNDLIARIKSAVGVMYGIIQQHFRLRLNWRLIPDAVKSNVGIK